jgi:hypothetical protein
MSGEASGGSRGVSYRYNTAQPAVADTCLPCCSVASMHDDRPSCHICQRHPRHPNTSSLLCFHSCRQHALTLARRFSS